MTPVTQTRLSLAKLTRAADAGLISVTSAAEALKVPHRAAALRLASLTRRGWARRVRRGLYVLLPLEVEPNQAATSEDSWVLAYEAFAPCYIGGWSAAEHWGFTEQLFRSTLVVTAAYVRARSVTLSGQNFRLFKVSPKRISGTVAIWRGSLRVPVSSRERTLVDCLRHPQLCGGIRHLAGMMRAYQNVREHDFDKLVQEATKAANGAAWKRLGYLAEILWPNAINVLGAAREHISAGYSSLDPAIHRRGRLVRRWNLWINTPITTTDEAA